LICWNSLLRKRTEGLLFESSGIISLHNTQWFRAFVALLLNFGTSPDLGERKATLYGNRESNFM
ncbi:MAG: hypothetical protein QGD88_01070, partial [Anaerolineae bacterium]|nr:hypothetical protein [Anaerolineae bacterium]